MGFAANMSGSYNPVVDSTSTRVWLDRFISVPPGIGSGTKNPDIKINLKVKHRQKYSGAGAATNAGESVYIICQSNVVAGTTSPVWAAGVLEEWFKP